MKIVALVAGESARLRRLASSTAFAWPAALGVVVLGGGALALADGRWLAASALWPFVVWGVATVGSVGTWRLLRRRLRAAAATARVAMAIEAEQRQRRGAGYSSTS